jgi:hypothetical protein
MDGESHDGVVAFTPLPSGREAVMLGRVQVGEISPIGAGDNRACFCLTLPESGLRSWRPAVDVDAARRQIIERINDWLNAADLRPNGAA